MRHARRNSQLATALSPRRSRIAMSLCCALSTCTLAVATQPATAMSAGLASAESLKKLSIEELMNVEVTTVSRSVERLSEAAAAIAVVTNEDIRRSGATRLPEALRGVPGLHVAQRNSNYWVVSSRGFSGSNSEKLLVLSDARSLYTPLFAGVLWDVQDYLLQDIDRIEVIRGPGATLWGSNAVNGVINIITKHSRDTQDLYIETGSGSEQEIIAGARYGGTIGEQGSFRVFGKFSEGEGTYHPGTPSDDDWQLGQVGFRSDWETMVGDSIMLQGAAYDGDVGQLAPAIQVEDRPGPSGDLEAGVSGGHVLGRWRHRLGEDSYWRTRVYYDHTRRNDPSYVDELDTIDLDFQHGFVFAQRHQLLWGLNYRHTDNRTEGKGILNLDPSTSQDAVISGFVQDQIELTETLKVTIGTKLEDNEFSEFEVQPSVRLAWSIAPEHTVWSAISRAVRVPTRLERDIAVDASDPAGNPVIRLQGNQDFEAEELLAYEAGYRWTPRSNLSVDLATFYNRYDKLASLELGTPFVDPVSGRTIVPILNQNLSEGDSHGIEALVTFAPRENWRLSATYSYFDLSIDTKGQDINRGRYYEGATPRHQAGLRSLLDLPGGLQLDAHLRYLSDIRRTPEIVTGEGLDGYTELDLRLAWEAWEQLEISVVGQNLLDERHVEFGSPATRGQIERSVYAKLAWGF
jgi:iron complex outermembrane recepter protein